jgi:hypothetical protein
VRAHGSMSHSLLCAGLMEHATAETLGKAFKQAAAKRDSKCNYVGHHTPPVRLHLLCPHRSGGGVDAARDGRSLVAPADIVLHSALLIATAQRSRRRVFRMNWSHAFPHDMGEKSLTCRAVYIDPKTYSYIDTPAAMHRPLTCGLPKNRRL